MTEAPSWEGKRPTFYNPFSGNKVLTRGGKRPIFRGFFRVMPLHRWSLGQIQGVFEYVAVEPSRFGFPPAPTCVVNTAYLLPSVRSRSTGVYVFGSERGCKNIIIPSSCNKEPFDKMDVKLIEPIFRWNPGASYVYLSLECQSIAAELAPLLANMRGITDLTLEGWSDPIAIHKVVMACKRVELLDAFALEDPPREWKTEAGVQALCTLIEMHPKLRGVCATRVYLNDWFEATASSRCKHNVALVPFGDDYLILFYMAWAFAFWVVLWYLAEAFHDKVLVPLLDKEKRPFVIETLWLSFLATTFGFVIIGDIALTPRYGKGWTRIVKHIILAKRYMALKRQGKSLVVAAPASVAAAKARSGGAASASTLEAKLKKFNNDKPSYLDTKDP